MKGLIFEIYHSRIDCTNQGASSGASEGLLVGADVPEIFEANGRPVFMVGKIVVGGEEHLYLVPIERGRHWFMFGGNFGYTSDGRWPIHYALPIHDRVEIGG